MSNHKGTLVIISGFSGAGKGTVVKELMKQYEQSYCLSVSATTRQPRSGEVHGESYFFLDKEEFVRKIDAGDFLEYAQYVGNYYGTPKDYVLGKMNEGISVILEIEMQGTLKIKEQYPEAVLIFITPPSAAELEQRLRGRGSETEEVISYRLSRAAQEVAYMEMYDYIVLNEDGKVAECASEIHQIVESEKKKTIHCGSFISQIKNDLAVYNKEGE